MFSVLDLLLGFAGLAVPAAITLACWLLVAKGSRHEEPALATQAHAEVPVVPAGIGSLILMPAGSSVGPPLVRTMV